MRKGHPVGPGQQAKFFYHGQSGQFTVQETGRQQQPDLNPDGTPQDQNKTGALGGGGTGGSTETADHWYKGTMDPRFYGPAGTGTQSETAANEGGASSEVTG
ncbi:hypothetical protein MACH10_11440 [Thalassospira tepidiphila]|nr:hypothetical protein MACH10_11440 [Thalassospira tepidiphila]